MVDPAYRLERGETPPARVTSGAIAHERRWWAVRPNLSIAARCAAEAYPLFRSQLYASCDGCRSTMTASRATFAAIDAAAIDARSRSPLTTVRTSIRPRSARA